jgi:hypothetical protein
MPRAQIVAAVLVALAGVAIHALPLLGNAWWSDPTGMASLVSGVTQQP